MLPPSAQAFCPTNGFKCSLGAVGITHEDMTKQAVKELDAEFFGSTRMTRSMKQAMEEIARANAEVDEDQVNGFKHFDGESFVAGKERLITLTADIKNRLTAGDGMGARRSLGHALHSIQDFYSHSTFIESGRSGALTSLWNPSQALPDVAGPEAPTCKDCQFVLLPDGNFFFDCSSNVITPALSSGYYGGENEKPAVTTKCRHGGPFDSGPGPRGGINKDTWFQALSEHAHLHGAAAGSAQEATRQFIRDLKGQITQRQLELLLGVGPTLVMVIDTSSSMGSLLDPLRAQALKLVDSRLSTDQEPLRYVLVPFNDPSVGPSTVTDDPDTFKTALSRLSASGGGDCADLSMSGALLALSLADEATDLFVFTDSEAKDSNLADSVSSLAQSKDARIHTFLFGTCLGFSSPYRRVASDTGGQVFQLGPSEAERSIHFMDAALRANPVHLLTVADTASGSKSFSVPVDSTVSRVTFSLSGSPLMTLTRPDGSVVSPADPETELIQLSTAVMVTVLNPAAGTWTVTLHSSGEYSLSVLGESPVDLDGFRFVETRGRPGHQGLFGIEGYPVLLLPSLARAELSGSIGSARIELWSKAGSLLRTLPLTPEEQGHPLELFGAIELPTSPFSVYVTGTLANGEPYQRTLSKLLQPQPVRVFSPPGQLLIPGKPTTYRFTIKNFGALNTFRVTALDARKFVSSVSPTSILLGPGETGTVLVTLNVPPGSAMEMTHTLMVTVESTALEGARNFAVMESDVGFPLQRR
jgi:hypothetical protein